MKVIIDRNQRIYQFFEEKIRYNLENELIGEITVKLCQNKRVRIMRINFKDNTFKKDYLDKVKEDLSRKKYNLLFFLLFENMENFNRLLINYLKLGFKTNFNKYPTCVYYKKDNIYRIITVYTKI